MAVSADSVDRLKSQLLTSGLSQKDQPLFQIINQLIDAVRQSLGDSTSALASSISSGSSGTTTPTSGTPPSSMPYFEGIDNDYNSNDMIYPSGLPGPVGPVGPPGLGSPGKDGIGGIDGIDGERGEDSLIPGPAGARGPIGLIGPAGIYGPIGPPGIDAEEPEYPYIIPGPPGISGSGGSGSLILLEQYTASGSASLNFTGFSSTYDEYLFELINISPATNAVDLRCRVSTNGGASYDATSNYYTSMNVSSNATALGSLNTNPGSSIPLATALTNLLFDGGVSGSIKVFNPLSASIRFTMKIAILFGATNACSGDGMALWNFATAVNAIQFLMSSGNIATGTIRLYGIKK